VVYPASLLDALQAIAPAPWAGRAFRHTFADYAPDVENTRGARWNPPGTAAIYTSLTREGVLAEAEHQLSIQPIRPRVKRTIHTLDITLCSVLDLTSMQALARVGIGPGELGGDDMLACQQVGGATSWLDHDGLLIPSARAEAVNLVIFPASRTPDASFSVTASELLNET
jgi:RES domain-containing protein